MTAMLRSKLIQPLVDFVQQLDSVSGVTDIGNPHVSASRKLVNIVSDSMNLRPKLANFLVWTFPDLLSLYQPDNERPPGQAVPSGLLRQSFVLLRRQLNVKMVRIVFFFHRHSFLRPAAAKPSARRRHRGQGLQPLQAAKMYIFAMLARSLTIPRPLS